MNAGLREKKWMINSWYEWQMVDMEDKINRYEESNEGIKLMRKWMQVWEKNRDK